MSLSAALFDPGKRSAIVSDCVRLVDKEVASKTGVSGQAVKDGYAAVQSIRPGFIAEVVDKLLADWACKLEQFWDEGTATGDRGAFFRANSSRIADALLSVTDAAIKTAEHGVVRDTYEKLRGSAKKNVQDAVPRLVALLSMHAG